MKHVSGFRRILVWSATCITAAALSFAAHAATGELPEAPPQSNRLYGLDTLLLKPAAVEKWTALVSRQWEQSVSGEWWALIASRAWGSGRTRIAAVNRTVNAIRYVNDPGDEWRSPVDFFRDGGDCEDYAIAKFLLLRALGTPASSMRIVALAATARLRAHAVLVVDTASGPVVLDNLNERPYALPRAMARRMVYAINDAEWRVFLGGTTAVISSR